MIANFIEYILNHIEIDIVALLLTLIGIFSLVDKKSNKKSNRSISKTLIINNSENVAVDKSKVNRSNRGK